MGDTKLNEIFIEENSLRSLIENNTEKILAIATWCSDNQIFQFSRLLSQIKTDSEYFSNFELRKIVNFLNSEAHMKEDPDGLILIKNMNIIYSMANESIPNEDEDFKDREFWGDDRND